MAAAGVQRVPPPDTHPLFDGIAEPRRGGHELAEELRPHVRARVDHKSPVAVRVARRRGRERFQVPRVVRLVARPVAGLAAVLIHDGLHEVVEEVRAAARAGALAKSVKQYGAKDICDALKESYSNSRGEMDWAALGRDGAGLFRAPPELNFFCGPLERPVKERKKVERKKKADLKDDGVGETKFEQREGGGGDGDEVCDTVSL